MPFTNVAPASSPGTTKGNPAHQRKRNIMFKVTRRRLSSLKRHIRQMIADDAGTAAVAAPNSLAFPGSGVFPRLFGPLNGAESRPVATGRSVYHAPMISAEGNRSLEYQAVKRAFDIVGAAALLIALSPILLTVLAVLAITTRGKPLFGQERV